MGRVDVIIPCYNYGHYLRACVESVLSQPVDLRALILDDASPDDTAAVAAELAAKDARITIRCHRVNAGFLATINEGVAWATADYTVVLSADDMLAPGALKRAAALMDAHPEVGLVYGAFQMFADAAELPTAGVSDTEYSWQVRDGIEWIRAVCDYGDNLFASPAAVVRTQLYHALGAYRRELPRICDLEMWLRVAAHANVGILDSCQAYYRVHGGNMHIQNHGGGLLNLQERRDAFEVFFRHCAARIPQTARLREIAAESLASDALERGYDAFHAGDVQTCRELLRFALDTYPDAKNHRLYARLQWMLRAGPRAWSVLRRLALRPT